MEALRYVIMGIGMLGLVVLGSCALVGYTAVESVKSIDGAGIVREAEKSLDRQIIAAHNERMNAEASDPDSDYYDDY